MVDALLQPTAANGVQAISALFERVVDGLQRAITRLREPETEVVRFHPVMSRALLEKSGYLKSFPHLLGTVSCLHGEEGAIRSLLDGRVAGQEWTDVLKATDLVLTPAACYPLYPLVAARGHVPSSGQVFDVESYCFRREATHEVGRLQSFRMREYVCIGSPDTALDFRERWRARAGELADRLGLAWKLAPASDPFFGRMGKLMAINQVERALKFELLVAVLSEEAPTACMSFNYHEDHFGTTWGLRTENNSVVHTACAAFGIDRLGLALFSAHGLDLDAWPATVRETLSL